MVGRIMVSKRCPHSSPPNLWICYATMQKRNKVAGKIKVANRLTWKIERLSGLSEQAQRNHNNSEKWKREAEESMSKWCNVKKTQLALAGFEDGRGPKAKEGGHPLDAGKDKKQSLRVSRRNAAWQNFDFSQVRPISDFWLTKLKDKCVSRNYAYVCDNLSQHQ